MEDEQLSIEEAARIMNISTDTVERWIDRGLPASRETGGAVRISRADLDAFLLKEGQGLSRDPATEF